MPLLFHALDFYYIPLSLISCFQVLRGLPTSYSSNTSLWLPQISVASNLIYKPCHLYDQCSSHVRQKPVPQKPEYYKQVQHLPFVLSKDAENSLPKTTSAALQKEWDKDIQYIRKFPVVFSAVFLALVLTWLLQLFNWYLEFSQKCFGPLFVVYLLSP